MSRNGSVHRARAGRSFDPLDDLGLHVEDGFRRRLAVPRPGAVEAKLRESPARDARKKSNDLVGTEVHVHEGLAFDEGAAPVSGLHLLGMWPNRLAACLSGEANTGREHRSR